MKNNKSMKKCALALAMCAAMALSVTACGARVTEDAAPAAEPVTVTATATPETAPAVELTEGDLTADSLPQTDDDQTQPTAEPEQAETENPVPTPAPTAAPTPEPAVEQPATQADSSAETPAAAGDTTQSITPAASSGFAYGAIPFSLANDNCWWSIDQTDDAYWAVLNNINAMRTAGGLSALSANSSLDAIADSRCDYQLVNNTLSHDGAQTPEILAQSQQSAAEVCTGWQNSPSHYAVIMNPSFTQIGICCYFEIGGKTIWCCTFG